MPEARPSPLERAVDRVPFLEKELFLLRRLVAPGDVCLDIGAAGGAHLLVMAHRAGPHGRVLGFEPRPRSHRVLGWLVERLGYADRVELFPVALAETTGTHALRVPVVPTRAHLHGSDAQRAAAAFAGLPHREVEVPTRTLDEVVADVGLGHVDVIKCDVEGAELAVLAGAGEVLTRHRPTVVLEADDAHQARAEATAADVLAAMAAHDYRAFRYRRGALEPVAAALPDEDDYVFVPTERGPRVPVRGDVAADDITPTAARRRARAGR